MDKQVQLIPLKSFQISKVRESQKYEKEIFDKLEISNYVDEDADGNIIFVDNNLPPETTLDIDTKIFSLSDNIYYNDLLILKDTLTLRTNIDTVNAYDDVWSLDSAFLAGNYSTSTHDIYALMVTNSKLEYRGMTWIFGSPINQKEQFKKIPFIGMYGIRSSIMNVLTKNKILEYKGITTVVLNYLKSYGKSNGFTKIVVPWPLPNMVPILIQHGFTEYNTSEDTLERQFLKGITSTSNYFTLDL